MTKEKFDVELCAYQYALLVLEILAIFQDHRIIAGLCVALVALLTYIRFKQDRR